MNTWKDDEKQVGPSFTQACDNEGNPPTNESTFGKIKTNAMFKGVVLKIRDEK